MEWFNPYFVWIQILFISFLGMSFLRPFHLSQLEKMFTVLKICLTFTKESWLYSCWFLIHAIVIKCFSLSEIVLLILNKIRVAIVISNFKFFSTTTFHLFFAVWISLSYCFRTRCKVLKLLLLEELFCWFTCSE